MLDAASYVSTNALDLSRWKPDFVTLSFYKIMGFPTGLGALLIHRRATDALIKGPFFGGGTVQMYSTSKAAHVPRSELVQRWFWCSNSKTFGSDFLYNSFPMAIPERFLSKDWLVIQDKTHRVPFKVLK